MIEGVERVFVEIAFSHVIAAESNKVSDYLEEFINGEENLPFAENFGDWPHEDLYEFVVRLAETHQKCYLKAF